MKKSVLQVFESHPEVKLVYLFGSTASDNRGPMSDYDFAVFMGEKDKKEIARIRFQLMDELSRALGTDKIDVVMLDSAESPELKYNILQEGKLIFEREPFRVLVEPRILNEYFDFHFTLKRHGLTSA
jgi:predicted nucleotidyltransferase